MATASQQRWSQHRAPAIGPAHATAFEEKLEDLHLDQGNFEAWKESTKLRTWCERMKNWRYIPEELLDAYGMEVKFTSSQEQNW